MMRARTLVLTVLLGVTALLAACTGSSGPAATSVPTTRVEMPTIPPATQPPTLELASPTVPPTATARPTATTAPTATSAPSVSPIATDTAEPPPTAAPPTAAPPTAAPPTAAPTARPVAPTAAPKAGSSQRPAIVVDHRSVDQFANIPDEYIRAAAALPMMFMDRSVGQNINEGLDCLSIPSTAEARAACKVVQHPVPAFSVSPELIAWNRPGGYDRSRWTFVGYPAGCDNWSQEAGCFMDFVENSGDQFGVVGHQFTYFDVKQGSTIEDQPGGFFSNNPDSPDVYDLAQFEARHPEKTVIYWTTSLARSIGSPESQAFNEQMRQYAAANGKVLFDVADILSHDVNGNPCYDNRDGVEYNNGGKSENFPDDGQNIPAICQQYTTEIAGGHLGSVVTGKIRVAKAFWVLMARLAGWSG